MAFGKDTGYTEGETKGGFPICGTPLSIPADNKRANALLSLLPFPLRHLPLAPSLAASRRTLPPRYFPRQTPSSTAIFRGLNRHIASHRVLSTNCSANLEAGTSVAPFEQADILFLAKERKEGKGNRKEKGCSSRAELSGFAELTRHPEIAGLAEPAEPTEVADLADLADLAGVAGYTEAAGFTFAELAELV